MAYSKAYSKAYYKANKEKIKARSKAYYEANEKEKKAYGKAYYKTCKDKRITRDLQKRYGITLEEKRAMYRQQQGCCAICGKELTDSKDCHVDHCHITGKIRGLLCSNCNHGLGVFKENLTILTDAIKYLEKYSG